MPTIGTATTMASISGGGGDGAQQGSCPPGSVLDVQATSVDVNAPTPLLSTDHCETDGQPGGCCTGGCSCEKCSSDSGAMDPWIEPWLLGGPGRVNPANGNLVLGLGVPDQGPLAAEACLYYNTQSTSSDNFGYGWGNALRRWIEEPSGTTADLVKGDGTVLHYTGYSASTGEYTPPPGATSKLKKVKGFPPTWTETRPDGFQYYYDSSGDLARLQNVAGARWTLTYTGSPPRLASVLDPAGRRTTYTYDGSQKLETITDGAGRETQLEVDGSDNLVRHVTPELCTTSLVYDGSHRLTSLVDPEGHVHSYTYDGASRVTGYQNPLGYQTTYAYQTGGVREITNPLGQLATLQFGSSGNLTRSVDPLGQVSTYTWDTNHLTSWQNPLGEIMTLTYQSVSNAGRRLASFTNAVGETTTYTYDANGRVEASIDPLGHRTTAVYNGAGQKTAVVDPLGQRSTYTYNARQQVTSVTNPLGQITTHVVDSQGNRTAQVNPLGQRTSYTYNAAAQVTGVEDPLGRRTTLTLDDMNRVLSVENPLGQRTSYTYDLNGKRTVTEDALGQRSTMAYDQACQIQAEINPLGGRTTYTYDAFGSPLSQVNPLGYATTAVYDAVGRKVAQLDPLGNRSTSVYDAAGRPTAQVSALGDRATTVYDRAGRVVAEENPLGQRTSYTFDGAGRRVTTVDPLGSRTTSVYDAAYQLVAQENALGQRSTSVYDAAGRTVAAVDPLGTRTTSVYDAAGRVVGSESPLGYRHTSVYDAAGQMVASIDPLGDRATLTYDAVGRRTASTNPLGEISTAVYDAAGRTEAVVDPLGLRTSFTYDAAGAQIAQINALGQTSTSVYDAAGRSIAVENPLGQRITSVYDAAGRAVAQQNPLGYRYTAVYDAAGRTVAQLDPLGQATTLSYDAAGRRIETINPLGLVATAVYDAVGRTSAVVDPLGYRTSYTYDAAGRRVAQLQPRGNRTTSVYDAAGRGIATIDGLGGRATFTYDAADQLLALTDAESQTTTYQYDAAGRKIKETYADHVAGTSAGDADYGIVELSYDAAGRLQRRSDQLGDTCTQGYDLGGRLSHRDYRTRVNSPSGTISDIDTFTYDGVGRMLTAENGRYGNALAMGYDAAGRLRSEALTTGGQTYTVTSTYDAAGRLTGQIYPDGSTVDRAYTARGELQEVKYNGGAIDTRQYDAAGRLIQSSYGNGALTTHTYRADDARHTIEIRDGASGLVDLFTFTYDANGNKTAQQRGGVMADWGFSTGASGYDNKDRLTAWNRTDGNRDQSWTLTYEGDWHCYTDAGTTQDRTHGPTHELTAIDSTSLTYDAKGNLTENVSGESYSWDFDNRLRTANVGGALTTLAYDALGRRVGQETATASRVVVSTARPLEYSPWAGQALAQYARGAAPGSPSEKFVYGAYIDEPIIKVGTGGTLYYQADDLHSVCALTDSGGAPVERYAYTAYGVLVILAADGSTERSSSSYANPYTFTGRRWDEETSLYYYRARYLDPQLGRFLGRDPAVLISPQRTERNPVVLALNRPMNVADPSGKLGVILLPEFGMSDALCSSACAGVSEPYEGLLEGFILFTAWVTGENCSSSARNPARVHFRLFNTTAWLVGGRIKCLDPAQREMTDMRREGLHWEYLPKACGTHDPSFTWLDWLPLFDADTGERCHSGLWSWECPVDCTGDAATCFPTKFCLGIHGPPGHPLATFVLYTEADVSWGLCCDASCSIRTKWAWLVRRGEYAIPHARARCGFNSEEEFRLMDWGSRLRGNCPQD